MARYIQVETAAENVLTYSRQFRAAISNWTNTRCTVTDNAILAPDGTLTADKITEDSSAGATHALSTESYTPDGSSSYVYSTYGKYNGRRWIYLRLPGAGFGANANCYFDLVNGVIGTPGFDADATGIEYIKNGWYRCWVTATSDAAAASQNTIHMADSDTGIVYNGDGSSGVYVWNAQCEIGTYPSSPIETIASPVTRPKDEVYWASADAPDLIFGPISFKYIPYGDETSSVDRVLATYNKTGTINAIVSCRPTSDTIRVREMDGGTTYAESSALTFSRGQMLTITLDPAAGSITVAGATTGNGTVVGTPWDFNVGGVDVWWGSNRAPTQQCDGLISEPFHG